MKAISLVTSTGEQRLALVVDDQFDTQAWATAQAANFLLLGVVQVVEEVYDAPQRRSAERLP